MSNPFIDTHIVVKLREPYWDAWQKYNWEKGIEGLGVREALVRTAEMSGKKLMIRFKYGDYEITAKKARAMVELYKSNFVARDGTKLIVIPRHKCKKISKEGDNGKKT